MKTLKELKEKIEKNMDKENLLYQWVKNDIITFNQFKALNKHITDIENEALNLDMWCNE